MVPRRGDGVVKEKNKLPHHPFLGVMWQLFVCNKLPH